MIPPESTSAGVTDCRPMMTPSWPAVSECDLTAQFMERLAPRLDFAILCAAGKLALLQMFAGKHLRKPHRRNCFPLIAAKSRRQRMAGCYALPPPAASID
jgi:hypothetical protein